MKKFLGLRTELLFHPESPGIYIWVTRSRFGRFFKSPDFATLGEAIGSR